MCQSSTSEAIAIRLEAMATRLEAIATGFLKVQRWTFNKPQRWIMFNSSCALRMGLHPEILMVK